MQDDVRYETVKMLLEANKIREFADIFRHIPYSIVANDTGINTSTLSGKILHPGNVTAKDVKKLARVFKIEEDKIWTVVSRSFTLPAVEK